MKMIKKIGRPVNEGELQDVKGEINPNDNSIFDLKEYMSIMDKRSREKDCDEDLLTIFQIIKQNEQQRKRSRQSGRTRRSAAR